MTTTTGRLPLDPRQRFSNRVEDYLRYRPRYPSALVEVIREETCLESNWAVADIGSGTGFSAEPFLDAGNVVYAVEPNPDMRRAAEEMLSDRTGFRSVAGCAEATGLAGGCVDLVVAGQAFHWFEFDRAREEFARILRVPRWVVLFWNTRLVAGGPFEEGYESLLMQFGTDYASVRHDRMGREVLEAFLGKGLTRRTLPHEQRFDYGGLEGRLRSSSYTPTPEGAHFESMLAGLRALFEAEQVNGYVKMAYETEIFTGRLD